MMLINLNIYEFFVGTVPLNQSKTTLPSNLNRLEITDLITFAIRGLFIVAGLLALLYLLLGGLAWITSGGNKESVDKARDKIQAAVIGLIVIVAVLAIVTLLEKSLQIGLGISLPIAFPTLVE